MGQLRLVHQMLGQMAFDHRGHQTIDRAADGGDLLQDRHAILSALIQLFFQRRCLSLYPSDSRQ